MIYYDIFNTGMVYMFNSWRTAATVQPGGLVESVERPIGSSIPVPNPYSVFHWIRWVFDEASQEVPHDQGTHRHKDKEQHHGPEEGWQEALTGLDAANNSNNPNDWFVDLAISRER